MFPLTVTGNRPISDLGGDVAIRKRALPLKAEPGIVDTLYSMIRIQLTDGRNLEIPREEALELLPYRGVFSSPMLKSPIEGLFTYRGKVIPLLGPLPAETAAKARAEERPWILLMKGCAQVVLGLPEFDEAARSDKVVPFAGAPEDAGGLLHELDDLLKSA